MFQNSFSLQKNIRCDLAYREVYWGYSIIKSSQFAVVLFFSRGLIRWNLIYQQYDFHLDFLFIKLYCKSWFILSFVFRLFGIFSIFFFDFTFLNKLKNSLETRDVLSLANFCAFLQIFRGFSAWSNYLTVC